VAQDSSFRKWLEEKLERHNMFIDDIEGLDSLVQIVDNWVFPESSQVHFLFKEALIVVLMKMPRDTLDYLVNGRVFCFIIPNDGVLAFKALAGEHYLCVDPYWFATSNFSVRIYVLAHELAHVYLDHPPGYPMEKQELEADAQVIKWGFEEELRSCPYNYLYGVGLDRLRINSRR
jgi:hypothetical protein